MAAPPDDPVHALLAALRSRHLPRAALPDIRKGIQALSTLYVEKRERIAGSTALVGEGKRAAFALFYSPLHFLTVRGILRGLGLADPAPRRILDLGCGIGVGGAAWALEAGGRPLIEGIDRSPWAAEEARWTLKALGLRSRIRRGSAERARLPGEGGAVIAAFAVNELAPEPRDRLLTSLLDAAARGARVLVVEPIARPVTPWWDSWSGAFAERGGRADEWRFPADLPEDLQELDRLAGLEHRELTARSLYLERGSGRLTAPPA